MPLCSVHFERLLIRLKRQWMLRRMLDGLVLGIGGGCVAAVAVFFATWRLGYQAPGPLGALAMLALAGGLGTAIAAGRRRSLAQIALMADRALDTNELFVSALFAQTIAATSASAGEPDAPWAAAVVAQAQRRAAELTVRPHLLSIIPPAIATRIRWPVFLLAGAVVTAAASLPAGRDPFASARYESSTVMAPGASDAADASGTPLVRVAVAMPPAAAPGATVDDLASRMDSSGPNLVSAAQDHSNSTAGVRSAGAVGSGESRTADASTPPPPGAANGAAEFDRAGRPAVVGGLGDAEGPGDAAGLGNLSRSGSFNVAMAGAPLAITKSSSAVRSSVLVIANPFATAADADFASGSAPDADRDLLRDYFSPNISIAPKGLP